MLMLSWVLSCKVETQKRFFTREKHTRVGLIFLLWTYTFPANPAQPDRMAGEQEKT
jgi:hypothetical protein